MVCGFGGDEEYSGVMTIKYLGTQDRYAGRGRMRDKMSKTSAAGFSGEGASNMYDLSRARETIRTKECWQDFAWLILIFRGCRVESLMWVTSLR
jgi:hypothetical protein